jgi:hypothetical protein
MLAKVMPAIVDFACCILRYRYQEHSKRFVRPRASGSWTALLAIPLVNAESNTLDIPDDLWKENQYQSELASGIQITKTTKLIKPLHHAGQ